MCFTNVHHESIESNTLFSLKQKASFLKLFKLFQILTIKVA